MFVLIGWFFAMLCVFGVFLAHGGNMAPLLKALPYEMTAIMGAAGGAFLAANSMKVVKATAAGIASCFKGSKYSKARYMDLMALLYDILQKARREGLMAIEKDVEDPANSPIFQKYPTVLDDHHVTEFITDYLRMMVTGNLNAHEIETLMDSEIETHHQEAHAPVMALQRMAGGLPAFGIVAAVLGVVNTMGSVGQPPAVLGGMIGGALVGTFLGVLMAYGMVGPCASRLKGVVEEESKFYEVIRAVLVAHLHGNAPQVSVETGRKMAPSQHMPTFQELEQAVQNLQIA